MISELSHVTLEFRPTYLAGPRVHPSIVMMVNHQESKKWL